MKCPICYSEMECHIEYRSDPEIQVSSYKFKQEIHTCFKCYVQYSKRETILKEIEHWVLPLRYQPTKKQIETYNYICRYNKSFKNSYHIKPVTKQQYSRFIKQYYKKNTIVISF